MSKSSRLTLAEITEVFRIIQEAIDNGNDPIAWRRQMLVRVCKLIDAPWGVAFLMPMQFDPRDLKPPLFVYTPLPPAKQKIYARVFRDAAVQDDPVTPVVARLAHKPTTLLRREMVDDETWYNSGAYKRWREPMGIDDLVHSHDPLPQFGVMSVMGFVRAFGDKPFTSRERKIVDLVREELRHRWISMKAVLDEQKPLTSRQQQLLTHLKGTMSEKQVAKYMGLSPHTTHNYIKHLYRRFKVNSRAELLQLALKENSTTMVLPRIGYGDA